jgi:hypothetical protein
MHDLNNIDGDPAISKSPSISRLVSVEDTIDDISCAALDEARRAAEDRKYRCNPGPILPPNC